MSENVPGGFLHEGLRRDFSAIYSCPKLNTSMSVVRCPGDLPRWSSLKMGYICITPHMPNLCMWKASNFSATLDNGAKLCMQRFIPHSINGVRHSNKQMIRGYPLPRDSHFTGKRTKRETCMDGCPRL